MINIKMCIRDRPRIIVEAHMAKFQISLYRWRRYCVRAVLYLDRHIKIFKDPSEQCHGSDHIHLDIQQRIDRLVHPAEQGYHYRNIADGQAGISHLDHKKAAHQVNQHRAHAGKGVHGHPEPAARHAFPNVQPGHFPVGLLIFLIFHLFIGEQFYQHRCV